MFRISDLDIRILPTYPQLMPTAQARDGAGQIFKKNSPLISDAGEIFKDRVQFFIFCDGAIPSDGLFLT
ncbi:MAG: hypothetical protein A3A24_01995 [Candidatus Buchananbacteria bacterium RIFCSPLOWO2_01_FULL_46_12]|uniref:Uncharacterized protein n=2 Tax=Candidatus Buchananiibacteriota TaxID=1817903 RepID=A0A1G1YTX3_9BACT|nr:MAG: hypothetical protein A2744_00115 [Candidatus Buchananbacteria bacterium RIFCSPHIGHO2_01_FULL_44_11]OGY55226.1 MAG: hypothetical protein A3A24_01995 [Candidatus Buchananbacteria bacterium RIFCSPLOWO2_01_FULL_46_12]